MKEFDVIYERWRNKLLHTNLLLTMLTFVVEVFMFFILKKLNLIEQPIMVYLWYFLFVPTIFNISILYVGTVVMKHMLPDSKFINYVPIIQLAAICMVIASTHNIFSMTLCIFCLPLFTTIMFNDKKMTRIIGMVCFLFMSISLLYRKFSVYRPKNDRYFVAEVIVAVAILYATYILCNVLIKFVEEKTDLIHQGYLQRIEMQELLNRDQKTGLFGQTIFMNTLDSMVEVSNRTHEKFALAVIDIDDFKKVNDTYGHLKGDQIIVTLTELMKKYFIENQFMARYGGEEFVIIFAENKVNQGINLLEDFRKAFEAQRYSFIDDKISISIGIAKWRQGWTSAQLFEAADKAMYTSKSDGKNRTTVYEN